MALQAGDTILYRVRGTFNDLLENIVSSLVADINTTYSTSYAFTFHAQREQVPNNSVRTHFFTGGGTIGPRFFDMCQVCLFTEGTPSNNQNELVPDMMIRNIMMGGILNRLGFTTKRDGFYVWVPVSSSPGVPTKEKFKLTIFSKDGWGEVDEPEENTWHDQITFGLSHR